MTGYLIDSHCHLDLIEDKGYDLGEVLVNSKSKGVGIVVSIGIELGRMRRLLGIVNRYGGVYCTVGVHPCRLGEVLGDGELRAELLKWSMEDKVVGIGESGLDYYRGKSSMERQGEVFRRHIEVARETSLPLVVHCREAWGDLLDILEEEKGKGDLDILLHCFDGKVRDAERAEALGAYISFSGIVTYKGKEELVEVVRGYSGDRILVETDAPYLVPRTRGMREMSRVVSDGNEPANVYEVMVKLGELLDEDIDILVKRLHSNFHCLFRKIRRDELWEKGKDRV